jgi:hypothetical protein
MWCKVTPVYLQIAVTAVLYVTQNSAQIGFTEPKHMASESRLYLTTQAAYYTVVMEDKWTNDQV